MGARAALRRAARGRRHVNIHQLYAIAQPLFRGRRHKLFLERLQPSRGERVLDVGGYPDFWRTFPCPADITCLNLEPTERIDALGGVSYVQGDARRLAFADREFDIVFSNSVIEHVGDHDDQASFASEVRRVGEAYWVQTPNRWFFVEPHLLTPFIHYLPRRLQRRLIRRFSVWGLVTKPSPAQIDEFFTSTHLLTRRELKALFPDAQIHVERVAGLAKSFIAFRRAGRPVGPADGA